MKFETAFHRPEFLSALRISLIYCQSALKVLVILNLQLNVKVKAIQSKIKVQVLKNAAVNQSIQIFFKALITDFKLERHLTFTIKLALLVKLH